MTIETPPNDPPEDATAAELAALRKEKADRDQAERDAEKAELADLRKYRDDTEAKAKTAVKSPTPKADKPTTPATPATTPATPPPGRRRGRGGASRLWFGEEDE